MTDTSLWSTVPSHLETYGMKVVQMTPLSAFSVQVDTPNQTVEGWFSSPASARLRQLAGDYVSRRRFRQVPRLLTNLYRDRTVPVSTDRVFFLTDHLPGRALEVTPSDVRLAAAQLALLHNAMAGLYDRLQEACAAQPIDRTPRYGTWRQALDAGRRSWTVLANPERERASANRDTGWADFVARWDALAEQSISQLMHAGYDDLAAAARARTDVAWNGYRLHATRRGGGQGMGVLQQRDPVLDDVLYDLATLCQEICEAGHAEGVVDALDAYGELRPLDASQRQCVAAFAAYPHRALTLARQRSAGQNVVLDDALRPQLEQQASAATRLLALTSR